MIYRNDSNNENSETNTTQSQTDSSDCVGIKPIFEPLLLISRIYQKSAHVFAIEWADGRVYDYTLADLQKNCPCARCRDEKTGCSLVSPSSLDPEVKAVRIYNLGRYALRVEFTNGCSRGVYTFDLLREWGKLSCG